MTASAGIVMHWQGSNETPESILRDADTALHRAKLDAKGSYVVFDNEMYEKALKFIEWKSGMQQAIQEGSFEVYYQPIVSVDLGASRQHGGADSLAPSRVRVRAAV